MTNVDDSYRAGVELESGINIKGKLFWEVNATLSRNRIRHFTEYVDNWDYWSDPVNEPLQFVTVLDETHLSFSPELIAASKLSYELIDNLKISLISKYVGKQYIDNTASEERKLDSYFLNDINASFSFSPSLVDEISIRFQANNIFNTQYESNAWVYRYYYGGEEYFMDGYFPQAGIHYMAGLSVRF